MTVTGKSGRHKRLFDAITTLVRYAASLARIEGHLPGDPSELETRLARMTVEALGIEQQEMIVAVAAQIDRNVERRRQQARVAGVTAHLVEFVRRIAAEHTGGTLRNQRSPDLSTNLAVVDATAKELKALSEYWELDVAKARLDDVAKQVVAAFSVGAGKNRQARVGAVIAKAAYGGDGLSPRTINAAISALFGVEQNQGLFQTSGSAEAALKAGPNERDIALWALSEAFPVASHADLVRMLDAARAVLDPRLQQTPGPLQQRALPAELPNRGDATPPKSKRPGRTSRAC